MKLTREKSIELRAIRRNQILVAAIAIAEQKGYQLITQREISEKTKLTESLVTFYFGSMAELRDDLMEYAISNELLPVIIQGLSVRNPIALAASSEIRTKAINYLYTY